MRNFSVKTVLLFCVSFFLFLVALHLARAGPTDPVTIPDTVLRSRIEDKLNKSAGDTITEAEMATITSLRSDVEHDIRELTGLEYAINLKSLNLLRSDPRTQAELLARPFWRTADLAPLSKLTKLEQLTIQGCVVFDMSPVMNLTNLRDLAFLYTYGISEIPDLSQLTALVHLRLETNRITDISGVRGLPNLRQLRLGANWNLSDITPLATLRNLEILRLDNTLVTRESLAAVLPFMSTAIDQMSVNEYPPTDIISGEFGISGTNISDLSVLDSLPNVFLWGLYLRFMGTYASGTRFFHLTDLTPLVALMNKGKVINSNTTINLGHNYGLDYASLYEDIPALLADTSGRRAQWSKVEYAQPNPMLEREFPKEASFRGHPRTRYTFSVRAVNTNPTFPAAWVSLTPHGTGQNRQFANVPVTWTVTAPNGRQTQSQTRTGSDGLASVSVRLGTHGETHTVDAVVPAKTTSVAALSHPELRVRFTVTADSTVSPPLAASNPDEITVTFLDYPQETPIDEFSLTIEFSEPIIGFEKKDITLQTALATGRGDSTLMALLPETPVDPDRPEPNPMRRCIATIALPSQATGAVRVIVSKDAATTPATAIMEKTGPSSNTASEFIDFGPALDEDARFRHPPALVVTQIDFTKGMFWIQNTTQYRFNVEMRIYSEDHKDKWFSVSERDIIAIEDAETLAFSLTPVATDDPSIIHLNSERLLRMNQNQPLKLSSEKFCIKLMRVIAVDVASNMNEDFRFEETRWDTPGDVIFRQYDASWDAKLQGLRRDHLAYYRFPLDGQLSDSWDVEASVPAAPSVSRVQSEVVLSAFRSTSTESGVLVEWTTASERANAGFYVLRSRDSKSDFVRVSPSLIVGVGTATEGNTYRWRDTTAAANVPYYYRLESVSLWGERRGLGTVRLRGFISSAGKLFWKWADVKTEEEGGDYGIADSGNY